MNMPHKYSTVLLDWDDTLWDFRHNAFIALKEVFFKYQLTRYFADFESFYELYEVHNKLLWKDYAAGKIDKDTLQRERFMYPFRQKGVEDERLARNIGDDFLETTIKQTGLVAYARELVEYLHTKSYQLIVLSNGFSEVQYRKINASGLASYIDHIVLSEDVGVQKPDPRIYSYAVQLANAPKEQIVMIGDNVETDIKGAYDFGLDSILFDPLQEHKDNPYATYQVIGLKEIENIL